MILIVGIDFHNMGVEEREIFSLSPDFLPQIYNEIHAHHPEAVFLSTCNRMEVYFSGSAHSSSTMINWLLARFIPSNTPEKKIKLLKTKFYHYRGSQAARHLFEVAAGLHSMVIGENQILHQIKRAYQDANNQLTLDAEFHKLFQTALGLGKKVRSQTDIGRGGMSLGSVSVDIIKKFYEKKSHFTVALIGAGEIAEEVLKSLIHHGQIQIQICNRDSKRVKKLLNYYQKYFNVEYIPFEERYQAASKANVIVVSTNAPEYVITYPELEKKQDGHFKFTFFIDLSVPRNIDPKISELPDIVLYTLDDLDKVISENYTQRSSQINLCHNLIEEQLQDFQEWKNKRRLFVVKQEWEKLLKDVNKERQKNQEKLISSKKLDIFFEKYYQKMFEWNEEELTKEFLTKTLEKVRTKKET